MWSEHCSYKSSRLHLKRLPTQGPQVLQGPGENAGVVDVGDGICAVFKIESHNHPSYVEPFQGAATGVGGILPRHFHDGRAADRGAGFAALRDHHFSESWQLAEWRRPRLRAISETAAANVRLLDGVVRGIAHYGNCFGVPTAGGLKVNFEPGYCR